MTVVRYRPVNGEARSNDFIKLSDILDDLFGNVSGSEAVKSTIKANTSETNDSYIIELFVPGISKDEIKVSVENEILSVVVERKENDEAGYTLREFNFNNMSRSFELPETADLEKISAKHNNGILILTIGKKDTAINKGPRNIDIS